jgi:hypothetical protein
MGVRTRNASASLVFGAAADTDALKTVSIKNDTVRTEKIFLSENIYYLQKPKTLF